jgi:hypothetical protein
LSVVRRFIQSLQLSQIVWPRPLKASNINIAAAFQITKRPTLLWVRDLVYRFPHAIPKVLTRLENNNMDDTASVKSASSNGTKRKREKEEKFYAVRVGKEPGVYRQWNQCLEQVKGYKGGTCKLGTFDNQSTGS